MKHAREYKRVTGRSLTADGFSRVWAGQDHFLLVGSILVYESYARVYFSDIRGIVWRPSRRFTIFSYVFGGLALFSVLVSIVLAAAAFIPMDPETREVLVPLLIGLAILSGSVFLLSFVLFAVNLLRGATCSCQFVTDRGPIDLRAPTRMSQLRKLLKYFREVSPTSPPPVPVS